MNEKETQKGIAQYKPGDSIVLTNVQMYPSKGRISIEGYDENGRIILVNLDTVGFSEIGIQIGKTAKVKVKPLTLRIDGSTKVNLSY